METEPIKLPESDPVIVKTGDKFKPLAIVFIIIALILAIATGFFVWQWMDQKAQIEDLNKKIDNAEISNKEEFIISPFTITEKEVWDIINKQNIPLLKSNGENGQIKKKEITRVERVSFGFESSQVAVIHIEMLTEDGTPVQDGLVVALYRNSPNDIWKYGDYSIHRTILGMCDSFKDNFDFAKAAVNELCVVSSEGEGPKTSSVLEYLGWDYFSKDNK